MPLLTSPLVDFTTNNSGSNCSHLWYAVRRLIRVHWAINTYELLILIIVSHLYPCLEDWNRHWGWFEVTQSGNQLQIVGHWDTATISDNTSGGITDGFGGGCCPVECGLVLIEWLALEQYCSHNFKMLFHASLGIASAVTNHSPLCSMLRVTKNWVTHWEGSVVHLMYVRQFLQYSCITVCSPSEPKNLLLTMSFTAASANL